MKRILYLLILLVSLQIASAHYGSTTTGNLIVSTLPNEPPATGDNTTIYLNAIIAGNPITLDLLDTVHGKKMHVFIVGQDLQTFDHTHPDDFPNGFNMSSQGIYQIQYTFPKAGKYVIVADYTVTGLNIILTVPITVLQSGYYYNFLSPPKEDWNNTKSFGEYTVTLESPKNVETGVDEAFNYSIYKDGKAVHDLQMYLESEIHLLAIRDDLTNPVHTHAYVPGHGLHLGNMTQHYIGPTIPVHITFPTPGNYSLFGQFEENGTVVTTQFMVHVLPPNNLTQAQYELRTSVQNIFTNYGEDIVVVVGSVSAFWFLVWLQKKADKKKKEK